MDMSMDRWNFEQGIDNCNFTNDFQMDSLEFNTSLDAFRRQVPYSVTSLGETFQNPLSSDESYTSNPVLNHKKSSVNENCAQSLERPTKFIKTDNCSWNSTTTSIRELVSPKAASCSSSSQLISFANSGSRPNNLQPKGEAVSDEDMSLPSSKSYGSYGDKVNYTHRLRSPSHARDHVMAERKRREKLAERIIALSTIVPGLKRMDKASVLGDAIKYLKQLQERVKLLEEQAKKKPEESLVFVDKFQHAAENGHDSSSSCNENVSLPVIEARISENNVLINIHCEKQNGFLVKLLREIEKLHLSVVNSNVMPFGNHAMDVTIAAQMDSEFCLTGKDLVRNLRIALL
ncbi:hypothetical protein RJ639_040309 [Escallonia herrerae]|uniref:BHLH domain-containing protein n=1 Tax=Escallonia herrerae TaxID=1293975 RepID=A0AA88WJC5_9ASTE|nr:hypothetical protein RJ639_040309 [Escallonia herrerae]